MFLAGANVFSMVLAVGIFCLFVVALTQAYAIDRASQMAEEDFRAALELCQEIRLELAGKKLEDLSRLLEKRRWKIGLNISVEVAGLSGMPLFRWGVERRPFGAAVVSIPAAFRLDNLSTLPCILSVALWRS